MPNNICVKCIRRVEERMDDYIVDLSINGVKLNGIHVTLEDNGVYVQTFFKMPTVDDGFGNQVPAAEFECSTEIEIMERLKEALIYIRRHAKTA